MFFLNILPLLGFPDFTVFNAPLLILVFQRLIFVAYYSMGILKKEIFQIYF
jgi:hypothetical protein